MTDATTNQGDLAQSGSTSQTTSTYTVTIGDTEQAGQAHDQAKLGGPRQQDPWEQRYHGLQGQLTRARQEMAALQERFDTEIGELRQERAGLQEQLKKTSTALESAEGHLATLNGEKHGFVDQLAQLEQQRDVMAAQIARQQVMFKFPNLVNDAVLKLVQASNLPADELEATLAAMAEGQTSMVKQAFQEAQTGSTGPVAPGGQPGTRQEQAQAAWAEVAEALEKGDMDTYAKKYTEYLSFLDETAPTQFSRPRTMSGQPL